MKKPLLLLIPIGLSCLIITLGSCSLDANTRPVYTGNRYLLAIGMDYPLLPAERQLLYAEKDAQDIASLFALEGYATELLTSSSEGNVTKSAIIQAIESRLLASDAEDLIVIFIAGHTVADGDSYAILTEDGSTLAVDELLPLFLDTTGQVVLLMDTCHAGLFVPDDSHSHDTQYLSDGPAYTHPISNSLSEAIATFFNPAKKTQFPHLWVLTSSGYHEQSFEPDPTDPSTDAQGNPINNGFFTHYLLRGLSRPARSYHRADSNQDKVVILSELFAYIKDSYRENPFDGQPLPRISGSALDIALAW